jgi:hypothetical protein
VNLEGESALAQNEEAVVALGARVVHAAPDPDLLAIIVRGVDLADVNKLSPSGLLTLHERKLSKSLGRLRPDIGDRPGADRRLGLRSGLIASLGGLVSCLFGLLLLLVLVLLVGILGHDAVSVIVKHLQASTATSWEFVSPWHMIATSTFPRPSEMHLLPRPLPHVSNIP